MLDIEVIEDPQAAAVALDAVRARLLAELAEPASAAALAAKVGVSRQKVKYHLNALEAHGLVAEVERRQWGGITERILQATASSYIVSPRAVDAAADDIRSWYVARFLKLRETAFRNPESYFRRYGELSEAEAIARAESLWDTINGPNLRENILPTRSRATLVLRKGADHAVRWVRLRKL